VAGRQLISSSGVLIMRAKFRPARLRAFVSYQESLVVPYADKALVCRDCGSSFNFSAGEQSFYATRGLANEPSRCLTCRNTRKAGAPETYVQYGRAASFGGRTGRQMHPTTCSVCGQMTEVPFVPRDDRPVFCVDCFAPVKRGGAPSRAGGGQHL